jgi:hypothetical protein
MVIKESIWGPPVNLTHHATRAMSTAGVPWLTERFGKVVTRGRGDRRAEKIIDTRQ